MLTLHTAGVGHSQGTPEPFQAQNCGLKPEPRLGRLVSWLVSCSAGFSLSSPSSLCTEHVGAAGVVGTHH